MKADKHALLMPNIEALEPHFGIFNNPKVQGAIAWFQGHGYTIGSIMVAILKNLPAVLAAIASKDPLALITLLMSLLGSMQKNVVVPS